MGRSPVDKMHASMDPAGREDLWPVIRETARGGVPGAWFTVAYLYEETVMPKRTISSYLACLVAGQIVERVEPDAEHPHIRYRLVRDMGVHAPRLRPDGAPVEQGSGVANLWRSMRSLKQFSPRDLSATATNDLVQVSEVTAKHYCKHLLAAGYLRVVQPARPPFAQAVYRLVRDSGPRPPQIQRVKQVFDPNTGKAHAAEDAA